MKFGFMSAMIRHNRRRTPTGAHTAARQRSFGRIFVIAGGARFRDELSGLTFRRYRITGAQARPSLQVSVVSMACA